MEDCWAISVPNGVVVIRGGLGSITCILQEASEGEEAECSCSRHVSAVNFMLGQVALFPLIEHSSNEMDLPVPIL